MNNVVVVLQDLLTAGTPESPRAAADAAPLPTPLSDAVISALGLDANAYIASPSWKGIVRQLVAAQGSAPTLDAVCRVKLVNVFSLPPPDGVFGSVGVLDSIGSPVGTASGGLRGGEHGMWEATGADTADEHSVKRIERVPLLYNTLDAAPELARGMALGGSVTSADESDDFHDAMEELKSDASFFLCVLLLVRPFIPSCTRLAPCLP
jgi:hypothetical protein